MLLNNAAQNEMETHANIFNCELVELNLKHDKNHLKRGNII